MHPRDSFTTFIFEGFTFDREALVATFRYRLGDHAFEETLRLDLQLLADRDLPPSDALEPFLFNLHLMAGINAYKTACPPQVHLESGALGDNQARFWSHLYRQGLGEYLYVNGLPPERVATFPADGPGGALPPPPATPRHGRSLVLLGGGKDSLTTFALLQRAGVPFDVLTLGDHPIYREVLAGFPEARHIVLQRTLSPEMLRLNREGFYNGHVPFSAHLAFMAVFAAWLGGYRWVILSNEASASEGNVHYRGMTVNHQYSKSLDFETRFQDYARRCLTTEVTYFSLLRPYSELTIAALFSQLCREHLETFSSCNTNFRRLASRESSRRWCQSCPKCVFTFVMLGAFLGPARMTQVLGRDLLDDAKLLPLTRELLGLEGVKPLECVGTADEFATALGLLHRRLHDAGAPLPGNLTTLLPALERNRSYLAGWSHRGRSGILPGALGVEGHRIPGAFLDRYPALRPETVLRGEYLRNPDDA